MLESLLKGNASFIPTYLKYAQKLPAKPRKRMAIITCTDTRLNPIRIFHINIGDAAILRNAGNIITDDVIQSLTTAIGNGVNEIFILGHIDCSQTKLIPSDLSRTLQGIGGTFDIAAVLTALESVDRFSDEESNVQTQVTKLRSSPIIPSNIPIHGLLFDIVNGTVKVVVDGYLAQKSKKKSTSFGLSMGMPSLNMPSISTRSIFTQPTRIADLSSTARQKGEKNE